jgi:hypothetical protein
MESDIYFCPEKPAVILRDLVCDLYKKSGRPDKGYCSTPSVMLSLHNEILINETGLRYADVYQGSYEFDIVDRRKFLLIKIKYGI